MIIGNDKTVNKTKQELMRMEAETEQEKYFMAHT